MGRRLMGMAAVCVLTLLGMTITVQAATVSTPYMAEQAKGKAPNVEVYLTGSKMSKSAVVSGSLEDITFSMDGEAVTFEESGEGISYIMLVDNSGSVNKEQFEEVKTQLAVLRGSLKEGDRMAIYTVGTTDSGGEKTLVFETNVGANDNKAKKRDCKSIEAIEYMSKADSKTVLYRSLNQILKEETSPKMRTVVWLITDGEDDSEGKDMDNVSTANTVKEADVPVYGILLNRKPPKTGDGTEQNEKISYTKNQILAEKNCRGFYYDCSVDAAPEGVAEAFATIKGLLQKETYVVKLAAPNNQAAGKGELKLTVDNSAVDAVTLDYSDYEEDKDAPVLVGEVEEISSNSISFSIQDKNGVNLADASDASNYLIQTMAENEDGKVWTIDSVNAVARGREITITLTMSEEFYNDTYLLRCNSIRDQSQDANEMDITAEFSITNGLDAGKVARTEAIKAYWWIGLIVLVVLLGVIIIFVIRRRKVDVVGINPDELEKADTKKIWLTITDRAGTVRDVEWDVEGSLFVGRSDMCNIYFDDDRLSRQHFVVEVNKMGCYIEDLETTNGTFVNGVKITNRRMLLDGDVITAGREKFIFHLPVQKSENEEAQ